LVLVTQEQVQQVPSLYDQALVEPEPEDLWCYRLVPVVVLSVVIYRLQQAPVVLRQEVR
jgi:hypothetical protein